MFFNLDTGKRLTNLLDDEGRVCWRAGDRLFFALGQATVSFVVNDGDILNRVCGLVDTAVLDLGNLDRILEDTKISFDCEFKGYRDMTIASISNNPVIFSVPVKQEHLKAFADFLRDCVL